MAELGKGVRVFVGYACRYPPELAYVLCETGTLIDGPFPPQSENCVRPVINNTWWLVHSDKGKSFEADERILFPIDPDDEKDTQKDEEIATLL